LLEQKLSIFLGGGRDATQGYTLASSAAAAMDGMESMLAFSIFYSIKDKET
jgi:hypothetical protein